MDVTAGQGPRLRQQGALLAGRRQLGHDARCVRDQLGRAGQLEGGTAWVAGPAGRLGRGAVEPDRLVARMPAPRHGTRRGGGAWAASAGSAASAAASSYRSLGLARHPPGVGESGQAHGELVGVGTPLRSTGWPSQPGAQVVGHLVEALDSSPAVQASRGRQAPAQVATEYVAVLADLVHRSAPYCRIVSSIR